MLRHANDGTRVALHLCPDCARWWTEIPWRGLGRQRKRLRRCDECSSKRKAWHDTLPERGRIAVSRPSAAELARRVKT